MGFVGGVAFVDGGYWDGGGLLEQVYELLRVLGSFARGAIECQRQADDDALGVAVQRFS